MKYDLMHNRNDKKDIKMYYIIFCQRKPLQNCDNIMSKD